MFLLAATGINALHGGAQLVSSMREVAPGTSFEVGVKIALDPGWHTYWQNPGDAGIPPKITWHLPPGWKAGEIQWPIPRKLIAPEVVCYGYEHEALLLVRLTTPATAKPEKVGLAAKVDWLVCQEGCVPATANVTCRVTIGDNGKPDSTWGARLREAVAQLPKPAANGTFGATLSDKNIVLSFTTPAGSNLKSAAFYSSDTVVEPSAPQTLSVSGHTAKLALKLSQFAPSSVPRLRGLLVSKRGSVTSSQTIDIPLRRTNL